MNPPRPRSFPVTEPPPSGARCEPAQSRSEAPPGQHFVSLVPEQPHSRHLATTKQLASRPIKPLSVWKRLCLTLVAHTCGRIGSLAVWAGGLRNQAKGASRSRPSPSTSPLVSCPNRVERAAYDLCCNTLWRRASELTQCQMAPLRPEAADLLVPETPRKGAPPVHSAGVSPIPVATVRTHCYLPFATDGRVARDRLGRRFVVVLAGPIEE